MNMMHSCLPDVSDTHSYALFIQREQTPSCAIHFHTSYFRLCQNSHMVLVPCLEVQQHFCMVNQKSLCKSVPITIKLLTTLLIQILDSILGVDLYLLVLRIVTLVIRLAMGTNAELEEWLQVAKHHLKIKNCVVFNRIHYFFSFSNNIQMMQIKELPIC